MTQLSTEVTAEGYLLNHQDWSPEWAESKAAEHQQTLEAFDWQVLAFVQSFYKAHGIMPLTRRMIGFIRETLDPNMDSLSLQARYSDKPLRRIALLAGLPKPIQCL